MQNDELVEQWRVRKLIKVLDSARGNGTSVITLAVPPRDQVSRVVKKLQDEAGQASNIQCRVNRQSVEDTISSLQQRIKLFTRIPPHGLVAFCGTVLTDESKDRKLLIVMEPFKPINTSMYMCDNKFHTSILSELLDHDDAFGFIIIDGSGALFGVLSGSTRTVLHKFHVDLPKKHGAGGQSQMRFARTRLEKRHNYIRKVAEMSTKQFISNDRPTVKCLIIAGSADFKQKLRDSNLFDPRLYKIVLKLVDVAYGFENGFNQAIDIVAEDLGSVKFVQEKQLLSLYFTEIARGEKFCFGVVDTMFALESGAVDKLIVSEHLDIQRVVIKNQECEQIRYEPIGFVPSDGCEIVESVGLAEWFADNFKSFGATLHFVSDNTDEGSQFCKGFGGIGCLLRYSVDFSESCEQVDTFDDFGL
jgi:peptide chain release factor subunit 1